jgi:hypothetical protein
MTIIDLLVFSFTALYAQNETQENFESVASQHFQNFLGFRLVIAIVFL